MKKHFVLDTNILIENHKSIEIIRNGKDGKDKNEIYIPAMVLSELDGLKKDNKLRHIVALILKEIEKFKDEITIIGEYKESNDDKILSNVKSICSDTISPILVTNDVLLQFKSFKEGIEVQEFKESLPFESESQQWTGFNKEGEEKRINSFSWENGALIFHGKNGDVNLNFDCSPWKVKPRNHTQNAAMYLMLNDDLDIVSVQSSAGLGKAQPLHSKILTPTGWTVMGDIKEGDFVIGKNGTPIKVIGVFPQGVKKCYKVTFNDGSETECCGEHLWRVRKEAGKWKTLELQEFKDDLYNEKRKRWNYFIPMVDPIEFEKKELPLNPYLLGVLIGDGSLTTNSIRITSVDDEILEGVKNGLPEGYKLSQLTDIDYSIVMENQTGSYKSKGVILNEVVRVIKEFKLDVTSDKKFIPEIFKESSINDRIQLLQGLMDTDGTINKKTGTLSFHTTSEKLKNDVVDLVNSLGGKCRTTGRNGSYVNSEGEKITCKYCYGLNICLPREIEPFSLTRKKIIYRGVKKIDPARCIVAVKEIGKYPCQCIKVDADDELYITDNYIVTHNTFLSLAVALHEVLQKKKFEKIIVFKNAVEIGESLGFLPGTMDEKMGPYAKYIFDLLKKLLGSRTGNKGKIEDTGILKPEVFEVLPLNYIRGMNIENAFVIVDEFQNISRLDARSLLSRMGQNVKCVCLGDTKQVDNIHLNEQNNGLNWIVKSFLGYENYAHVVLKGKESRGPITDLVLKSGL